MLDLPTTHHLILNPHHVFNAVHQIRCFHGEPTLPFFPFSFLTTTHLVSLLVRFSIATLVLTFSIFLFLLLTQHLPNLLTFFQTKLIIKFIANQTIATFFNINDFCQEEG